MAGEASWLDAMPEIYDRCLGPTLFAPHARHLARLAAQHAPATVLELAAGTGILTEQVARAVPSARITATDLNGAMVSWGAQQVPSPTWRTADAQALDLADESFDLVLCQFGVMFLPDKPAAFAEMARVLRPDGVLLFSVWDAVETSPITAALQGALADVFPDDPPDFVTRVPHGYHDVERIRRDVEAGGLALDGVERVVPLGRAESAATVARGFCFGTPLRFALQERGDLEHLAGAVTERLTARLGDGPVVGELAALVVSARPTPATGVRRTSGRAASPPRRRARS